MVYKEILEVPQRSCLGCRASKDKNLLLRYVITPEMEIFPDLDNRLPGRGAYTCISKKCLAVAVDRQQFKRAFKQDVTVMPTASFIEHVSTQLNARIIGLIGLANKAGLITAGGSMVTDLLKSRNKPGIVIVATDVSTAIGEKIIHTAEHHKVKHRTVLTKIDFAAILGKAPKSAIAVASSGFIAQLVKAIDRYRNFLGEV